MLKLGYMKKHETLLQRTIRLMQRTDININEICEELGVSRRWYNYLKVGQIADPSVNTIERLHELLSR